MIDNIILAPYWLTLKFRNWLYDSGIKKVSTTQVPSICVGNVTVGGTGKTPHTEMLIRILQDLPAWKDKRLAVLSRGYKRRSRGFHIVDSNGTTAQFGDEPLQIKRKFPDVVVAVDKDRVRGCKTLTEKYGAEFIILEDAFQYRSLKANATIVLVDYNRPVFKDSLMPLGRLRDLPGRVNSADIVIVTKCPSYLRDSEKQEFLEKLKCRGKVFFTSLSYDDCIPVFPDGNPRYAHSQWMILFTGIANDEPLVHYASGKYNMVKHFRFSDHHVYTRGEIAMIRRAAETFPNAVIATTEKDGQRLVDYTFIPDLVKERLFQIPVRPHFLNTEDDLPEFTTELMRLCPPKYWQDTLF